MLHILEIYFQSAITQDSSYSMCLPIVGVVNVFIFCYSGCGTIYHFSFHLHLANT